MSSGFKTLILKSPTDSSIFAEYTVTANIDLSDPNVDSDGVLVTISEIKGRSDSEIVSGMYMEVGEVYDLGAINDDWKTRGVVMDMYMIEQDATEVRIKDSAFSGPEFIAKLKAEGGTISAPHEAATLALINSMKNGTIDFMDNTVELFLAQGENYAAGRLGAKGHFNMTSAGYGDAEFTVNGMEALDGSSVFRTGITMDSYSDAAWSINIIASDTVDKTWFKAVGNSEDNFATFASDANKIIAISGTAFVVIGGALPARYSAAGNGATSADLLVDGVSEGVNNSPDNDPSTGEFIIGGDSISDFTNAAEGDIGYFYIGKGGLTTALLTELDGYFATWLTAVGR